MARFVPLKLNAGKDGKEIAERYSLRGVPTMVFVDADGNEVDRLVGYLPPDEMVAQLKRIGSGDTFAACLKKLDSGPVSVELVRRVARGHLDRSDAGRAIELLTRDEAAQDPACRRLLFQARAGLHRSAYARAARALVLGRGEPPEVEDQPGLRHLLALLGEPAGERTPEEWSGLLREARRADCSELLDTVGQAQGSKVLLEVADVAMAGGLYDRAAGYLSAWWKEHGAGADAAELNQAAWNLYLMRRELPMALEMAERAHAADPDPSVADTLARLLYVNGQVDRAVEVERDAAAASSGQQKTEFEEAVRAMRAGEELEDRPPFERFAVPAGGGA